MRKAKIINLALLAVLLTPMGASADWVEGFESYNDGTLLHNVDGWKGWDDNSALAGVVSDDQARTGDKSIVISNGTDAIYDFGNISSGIWTLTAYQYVVSDVLGENYFITQNVYNDGGPYDWAIQMWVFPSLDVIDDFRPVNAVSAVSNQWVQIRHEIDLGTNSISSFYDNQLLSSGVFANTGPVQLATLDLFSTGGLAYYDDISLTSVPEPGTLALLGLGLVGMAARRRKTV